ncbi:hypothetical protein J6N69_04455 [bacterium]|nr:hypothetical protein [bacterium]
MKKIICYGDSNTFGFNPKDGTRFDENIRWTSVLQMSLGVEYEVINEGMCDRTGFIDNDKGFLFSAQRHFPKLISKCGDIDFMILWIGTNDLQFQYKISISAIENGLENLIKIAKTKAKKIIIIPPVILNENILRGYFNCQFDETGIVKSRKVGRIYRTLAGIYGCEFFDVNKLVKPSDIDGLHYDGDSHKIIAENLFRLF